MIIVTNNPKIKDKYDKKYELKFIDDNYISVLKYSRDLIHKGFSLINHPLYGSIKPNETPFRTIILKYPKSTNVDYNSLEIIENSLLSAKKFLKMGIRYSTDKKAIDDFSIVDLSLITSILL